MIGVVQAAMLGGSVKATGFGITYTLRVDPSGAADATLTNGITYDDTADWILNGAVKIFDTSTGSMAIESGKIKGIGTSSSVTTGLVGTTLHTWGTPGRITKFRHKAEADYNTQLPWYGHRNSTTALNTTNLYGWANKLSASVPIVIQQNGVIVQDVAGTDETVYEFAMVEKTIGYDFWIKGGTQYPEWTLIREGAAGQVDYAAVYGVYRGTQYLEYLAVTSSAHTEITAALLDAI